MPVEESKIFFSYARADAEFVLRLAKDLRSAGINLWMDQLDIRPGDRWDSAVEKALRACQYLLVILSPASVASQNVMDEVSAALESNKRIVPVHYRDTEIPFRLKRVQYIDFRADYDKGFEQLLKALDAVPEVQTSPLSENVRQGAREARRRTEAIAAETETEPSKEVSTRSGAFRVPSYDARNTGATRPRTRRSLTGILTSIAVVIAAVAALILFSHREARAPTPAPTPSPTPAPTPSPTPAPMPAPTPTSVPSAVLKVYIHTSEDRDRGVLEEIGNALREKGYQVPDTRLTSAKTAGDVRFFFPQDREDAARLKSAVETELSRRGYQISLELLERDGTKFQYSAPGKIEIWLPPIAKGARPQ